MQAPTRTHMGHVFSCTACSRSCPAPPARLKTALTTTHGQCCEELETLYRAMDAVSRTDQGLEHPISVAQSRLAMRTVKPDQEVLLPLPSTRFMLPDAGTLLVRGRLFTGASCVLSADSCGLAFGTSWYWTMQSSLWKRKSRTSAGRVQSSKCSTADRSRTPLLDPRPRVPNRLNTNPLKNHTL